LINSLKNLNDNLNEEITLQTDYITPISNNQSLEFGAKGILRSVNSDYSYLIADAGATDYNADFTRPSGTLDYSQNVTAAYTSYTYSTASKYTVKAGIRWENTAINATQDDVEIDLPNYNNFVPSLNLSKSLKGFSTIKLGYNRRIQRPGLQQLNPNFNLVNNQDIRVGNPNLRPELTNNLELGYSTMVKKTYINTSIFGRITDNAINQIRYPIDSIQGAILTTYENIGRQRSFGTNIFANLYLTDKWTVNGGVDVYYTFLEGQVTALNGTSEAIKNNGINFGGRIMSQMQLNKDWSLQAFSFMRGRQVDLQGTRGGFGMYSIGMRKSFANKKGSFGFSAENFANRGWNVRTELESPQLTQVSNMLMLNRNFKVNVSYKFGKLTFSDSKPKTRSVRNDDVMGGGGEGMGGDAGAAQSSGGGRGAAARPLPGGNAPKTTPQPAKENTSKTKKEKSEKEN
jgi:outer membrane receptor protein involved in Fe transport